MKPTSISPLVIKAIILLILIHMKLQVTALDMGQIRYFGIFHDLPPGQNLCFRKPEKISKGEDVRVWPTRSRGLSRYRVMVNSQGVISRNNQVPRVTSEATESPIGQLNWSPVCLSFSLCLLYSYYFSLIIGMMIRLVGLK